MFKCPKCSKSFARNYNLKCHLTKVKCDKNHVQIISGLRRYCCFYCEKNFSKNNYLKNHMKNDHKLEYLEDKVKELENDNKKLIKNMMSKNHTSINQSINGNHNTQTNNNQTIINQNIVNQNIVINKYS